MGAIKLKNNVYSVGVLNPSLRVFDIIMESRYGTSYNAYLITGEKNVLIDTVHAPFFDEYLNNIQSVIDISKIDYLIMDHTEPDHSGSVGKLLEMNPNITVYCTTAAKMYLSAITNRDFQCVTVKQGDKLSIGEEELEFIIAPLLHWPDSMFVYMGSEKTLFTCDFLGTHYCEPTMLDTTVHYPDKYSEQFKHYYNCIFGPFKPYVLAGLDKIKDLPVTLVCPSHGPCLTESIQKCEDLYREWSTPVPREKKTVGILYASAYGCTGKLAEAAYDELKKDEKLDAKLINVVFTPLEEAAKLANEADALLIGSCTINRDAPKVIWDILASVDAINTRQKPAGAFGAYGWSGEAVPMMKSRMEHLKFRFIGEGFRVLFNPTDEDLTAIRAYAKEIASNMK
ncbi:FprA family A-type flavoprotein [Caproiciproducens sp. CPB-2]|uniref:FprA family A-type flavoprotein n=1 Tax=Caproiciproducens sp. CPB-2 TaxID=3030017 RepID=UPI0023DA101A|nr:FprA family A-type flavoprotein [Caproiciproducens sp. CPB-2]MDF1493643.1 FprA family A-type flavoprotein [Caproiciproducens sp. CPB-2]